MRLLTLNTHSLAEENYDDKCDIFVNSVIKLKPDVIAMQEVNQSIDAEVLDKESNLKADNHGLKVLNKLKEKNVIYYLSWLCIKKAYGKYDEGLAFLSKTPITATEPITISKTDDYYNWKTRKAFVINTNNFYFCNTHMGWWNDKDEPFRQQFDKLNESILKYKQIYLMGDFNSPSNIENEGYGYVCSKGWKDTYMLSREKDIGYTVKGKIAGWENYDEEYKRIDYIFTKGNEDILKSQVVFNGTNEKIVSDHYGVMVDIKMKAGIL